MFVYAGGIIPLSEGVKQTFGVFGVFVVYYPNRLLGGFSSVVASAKELTEKDAVFLVVLVTEMEGVAVESHPVYVHLFVFRTLFCPWWIPCF